MRKKLQKVSKNNYLLGSARNYYSEEEEDHASVGHTQTNNMI